MQVTAETLARMSGREVNDNMRSVIDGLAMAGIGAGLNRPHRLAIYLGQIGHVHGAFSGRDISVSPFTSHAFSRRSMRSSNLTICSLKVSIDMSVGSTGFCGTA